MPKVTVYMPSYNYAHYVEEAIESVLNQTFQDFELLIFNDGSTDNTKEILKKYENNPKIKIFHQENLGFPKTCNKALQMAQGEYIIRLDADDVFDENILLILSKTLDDKPNIGLVYPDYFEMDEKGKFKGVVIRKKLGEETKLLDLPAHGACTMIRKKYLKEIGGYNEDIKCQDGYDLWIRFIQKYKPCNINLPLFHYRKHSGSVTAQSKKILETRKEIKENFVEKKDLNKKSCLIIPIRKKSKVYDNLPLKKINNKHLMEYITEEAVKSKADKVVMVTESEDIAEVARKKENVEVIIRPEELAAPGMPIEPTVNFVLNKLKEQNFSPNIIGVLFYTSPLIKSKHLNEAINTLLIYEADSVVGVRENPRFHYIHDELGLKPLFKKRSIKHEREYLYEESGSFVFSKIDAITENSLTGKRISHIVLTEDESVDIEDKFTFWLAEKILTNREEIENLDNKKITRGY